MARINIEDKLLSDIRFIHVADKIGRYLAIGQFYFIARLAQKYWSDNESFIPKKVYLLGEFSDAFLSSGLVEIDGDCYKLAGTSDQFAWLRANKVNGSKGGRPRKNNNIAKPIQSDGVPIHNPNKPIHNPLTLTLTPALTLTQKKSSSSELRHIIIDYLNKAKGSKYSSKAKAAIKAIDARLKDGYKLEDFTHVIDVKCQQWKGTPQDEFLRPETLFGNKFDGYLNQKIKKSAAEMLNEAPEIEISLGELI